MRTLNCTGMMACICLLVIAPDLSARADIYKWVDEKGVIHFSDQPPGADGREIEQMPSAPPSTDQPPPKAVRNETEPAAKTLEPAPRKQTPARPAEVELYVTSWCKYCKLARNYLLANKIPFKEYDIEKDPRAARRRNALDKRPGVPLAVINGYVIIGFSERSYEQALKAAK